MLQTIFTTLIKLSLLFPMSPGAGVADAGASTTPSAQASYLAHQRCLASCDEMAAPTDRATCDLNCDAAQRARAFALEASPRERASRVSSSPAPDGIARCLDDCDEAASPTDQATCRLNCEATWSSLRRDDDPCDHAPASASSPGADVDCGDAQQRRCEQRCYSDASLCR